MSIPNDATPCDNETTLADVKRWVKEFSVAREWERFHFPKELAVALAIEAAEVMELGRFKSHADVADALRHPEHRRAWAHELADCLWALVRLADVCGIDLASALDEKLKLADRKYPVDQSKGRHDKYTAYQEEEKLDLVPGGISSRDPN
ncbi:hypothetical protein Isop_1194 [Isosphaera pallida ATCC 43644]|uniref:MazG nucleotide pyrophosphohydrolase n=1 Tax=Isosphaera pallida (strain ATCC 43644 / DSM 9630 / IS1B) TaxID=575540 RepID=E8R5N1_ISOPI|nr:nucleotide pyrophosphohydrolase [Isosphaera pallida]ADV61780.1 hypothetical protein Isop_1194 [Isosphaera pallida ATCC 43644]